MGGVIGMLAGCVRALDRGVVQPDNYSRDLTFLILTALVLGGLATVTGSILGPMLFWAVLGFTDNFLNQLAGSDGVWKVGGIKIIANVTQVGQIRLALVGTGPDAADDLPPAGAPRQPQGDGARWPLTTNRSRPSPPRSPRSTNLPTASSPWRRRRSCATSSGCRALQARPDPHRPERAPTLRRRRRRRRRHGRGAARLDHRLDRSQRRRQDDVLQPAVGLREARRRHVDVRRPRHDRRRRPPRRVLRDGAHVPAHEEPHQAGGHREHEARRHRPAGRAVVERPVAVGLASAGERDRAAGRRAAGALPPRPHAQRVRRHAVGRSAQAPGDGQGVDDEPAAW